MPALIRIICVTIIGTGTSLTQRILKSLSPPLNSFEGNQVNVYVIYSNAKFDKTDNIVRNIKLVNDLDHVCVTIYLKILTLFVCLL